MLVDKVEAVTVDQALEDLDDRWFAAEAQAHRYGEQFAWHMHEGYLLIAQDIQYAQIQFITQFGPWKMRRLAETFWIATKNVTLSR